MADDVAIDDDFSRFNIFKRIRQRISLEEFLTRTPKPENKDSLEWKIADHPNVVVAGAALAGAIIGTYLFPVPVPAAETHSFVESVSRYAPAVINTIGCSFLAGFYTYMSMLSRMTGIGLVDRPWKESAKSALRWYVASCALYASVGLARRGYFLSDPQYWLRLAGQSVIITPIVKLLAKTATKVFSPTYMKEFYLTLKDEMAKALHRSDPEIYLKSMKSHYDSSRYSQTFSALFREYVKNGKFDEALELSKETPLRDIFASPGDNAAWSRLNMFEMYMGSMQLRKNHGRASFFYPVALMLHRRKDGRSGTVLEQAALRIPEQDNEVSARQHIAHAEFCMLSGEEKQAQEHLAKSARLVANSPIFDKAESIDGHTVFKLQDSTFKKYFVYKLAPAEELEEERRMTKMIHSLDIPDTRFIRYLVNTETVRGMMGVTMYTDARTVGATISDSYDRRLHERMVRSMAAVAASFSPASLVDISASGYVSRVLADTKNPLLRRPSVPQIIDECLPLLQKFVSLTPIVTYLDSHPEQYLFVSKEPFMLERLDIQNKGRREFSFELSKAIERSPLAGRDDDAAVMHRDFLLHAGLFEYNAMTGRNIPMEEARLAKLAADVLAGLTFAAKHGAEGDVARWQGKNLKETLAAGLLSMNTLCKMAPQYIPVHERESLALLRNEIYAPLCKVTSTRI